MRTEMIVGGVIGLAFAWFAITADMARVQAAPEPAAERLIRSQEAQTKAIKDQTRAIERLTRAVEKAGR